MGRRRSSQSNAPGGAARRRLYAALAGLGLAACGDGEPAATAGSAEQAPIEAAVIEASVERITLWDEYIGRFQATERVELRPRVSGYIDAVHFEDGETVEENQLLFTIDREAFAAAYARADAEVVSAETQVDLTASELRRADELLKARAGSQEEYDRRLQANEAAIAAREAAKAERRQAALDLEHTEVRAPIAGRVSRDLLGRGNFVTEGQTALTTIVSIDPIEFAFTGSEQDFINYLRLDRAGLRGSSIYTPNPVRIALVDQEEFTIEGRMKFIDNEIDTGTSTISASAVVDNPDGFLTPGMFGRLQLYGRDPFDAVIIPERAVQFDQNRRFVWTLDEESKARQTPVEIGRNLGDGRRIVESGLSGGERIVVGNFFMLRPGAPVKPVVKTAEQADAAAPR